MQGFLYVIAIKYINFISTSVNAHTAFLIENHFFGGTVNSCSVVLCTKK